jgi:hypothetical protein
MKTIISILLVFIASFLALSNQSAFSQHFKADTIIKEDSMNLAIFIVDFTTYNFESANISYYTKCTNSCDDTALPFIYYFDSWWDYAHVYFNYTFDNSLFFKAEIVWMGAGQIEYPTSWTPASNFPYMTTSVSLPSDAQYYDATLVGNYYTWPEYKQMGQMAWKSIDSLEITNEFASKPFRVGLFGYSRTEAPFYPSYADWIIFLYRGNTEPASIGTVIASDSLKIFPNPSNGKFLITPRHNLINVEIYNLFGKRITICNQDLNSEIDLTNQPNGIYLVKSFLKKGIVIKKVSIIH